MHISISFMHVASCIGLAAQNAKLKCGEKESKVSAMAAAEVGSANNQAFHYPRQLKSPLSEALASRSAAQKTCARGLVRLPTQASLR